MRVFRRANILLKVNLNQLQGRHTRALSFSQWPIISEADLTQWEHNNKLRQHANNIPQIRTLLRRGDEDSLKRLQNELYNLPNSTHPRLAKYGSEPLELARFEPCKTVGSAMEFSQVCKHMNLLRMAHLGNYTGHKSYYLLGRLAELEMALVQYALATLKKQQFQLISVPDILPGSIITGCGMNVDGDRNQVYKLEDPNQCLSGTAEMALAGFYADKLLDEAELPLRVMAVSRCYRAETSAVQEEKGIYRVHQFTKVEMFSVCTDQQSGAMLMSFRDAQVSLFEKLNLNFRLLDMPPFELGAPAYEKYDIEAWMPGRQMWGEISSCSNCTEYQAKRLRIRYKCTNGEIKFAHTVNGTAVAIPRLLVAIVESNQLDDYIAVPAALSEYMKSKVIRKNKLLPDVKLVKAIKCA